MMFRILNTFERSGRCRVGRRSNCTKGRSRDRSEGRAPWNSSWTVWKFFQKNTIFQIMSTRLGASCKLLPRRWRYRSFESMAVPAYVYPADSGACGTLENPKHIGGCVGLVNTVISPHSSIKHQMFKLNNVITSRNNVLEASWGCLSASQGRLGASWAPLGAVLEQSWSVSEASWNPCARKFDRVPSSDLCQGSVLKDVCTEFLVFASRLVSRLIEIA